jgi:hypothetical protein
MPTTDRDYSSGKAPHDQRGAYHQEIAGCLSGTLGTRGLDDAALTSWLDKLDAALDELAGD